jgi:hypothetical protein
VQDHSIPSLVLARVAMEALRCSRRRSLRRPLLPTEVHGITWRARWSSPPVQFWQPRAMLLAVAPKQRSYDDTVSTVVTQLGAAILVGGLVAGAGRRERRGCLIWPSGMREAMAIAGATGD